MQTQKILEADAVNNSSQFHQTYFQGPLQAFLHCDETGCRLEIAEPLAAGCACYRLEVLLQPVNEFGWPIGQAQCLWETEITMHAISWSKFSHGHLRLPNRLPADLLRRCHLRLTCSRFDASLISTPDH